MKKDWNYLLFFMGFLLIQISSVCVNIKLINEYLLFIKVCGLSILFLDAIISMLKLKTSAINWILFFLLTIIGIASYYVSETFFILPIVLLIFSSVFIDFKYIIKQDLLIKCIIFFIVLSCHFLGFTNELLVTRDGVIRSSFGFFHPNTFAMFVTIMIMDFTYIRNKTKNTMIYVICILMSIFIIKFVDSRTSIICLFAFCALLFIEKKILLKDNDNKLINFFEKNLYLIMLLISYILTVGFINGNELIYRLDTLLSGRIWIQNLFFRQYEITLFGNPIEYNITLDNVYMRVLLAYGLVGILLFTFMYSKCIITAQKNKDYKYMAIIMTILLYGLMEHTTQDICFCPFILYFCKFIFERKVKNER